MPATYGPAPHQCLPLTDHHHYGADAVVSPSPSHHLKAVLFDAHNLPDQFPHHPAMLAARIA
jgi:hypothetical protein